MELMFPSIPGLAQVNNGSVENEDVENEDRRPRTRNPKIPLNNDISKRK